MRFLLSTILLFSLAFIPRAGAEASAPDAAIGASGVLASVEAAPGADPALLKVVVSALDLQFMRRNARFDTMAVSTLTEPDTAAEGLRQAAEQHQQLFLFGEYSTSSKDLTLTIHVYDVRTGSRLSSASVSGPIGLSLDSVVARVLDQVLAGLTIQPAPQPLPPAETGAKPAAIPPGDSQVPGATRTTTGSAARPGRIALATGVAPFIPLGNGTYAEVGVLATFSAVYRFPAGPGLLGVGVLAGVSAMNAAGVASTASLLLVPLGAEVSYSMNEGGLPGILFHVSAGPALMSVATSYEGTLSKPVPYLLAGMRVDVPFTSYLGLSLEAAWTGFFESMSTVIMGFAPEVSMYVRF
jgi:hypothetical protein